MLICVCICVVCVCVCVCVEVNRDEVAPKQLYSIIQSTTQQHLHYSSKTSSTRSNRNSQLDRQLTLMSQYHYTVSISVHISWERKQSEPTPPTKGVVDQLRFHKSLTTALQQKVMIQSFQTLKPGFILQYKCTHWYSAPPKQAHLTKVLLHYLHLCYKLSASHVMSGNWQ
jgi:hypothetical protein